MLLILQEEHNRDLIEEGNHTAKFCDTKKLHSYWKYN